MEIASGIGIKYIYLRPNMACKYIQYMVKVLFFPLLMRCYKH